MIAEATTSQIMIWLVGICGAACAGALFMLWLAKKVVVDEETESLQMKWKETKALESIESLDSRINGVSKYMSPATSILMIEDLKKLNASNSYQRLAEMEMHVQETKGHLRTIEAAVDTLEE